jgi:hypothetical protein
MKTPDKLMTLTLNDNKTYRELNERAMRLTAEAQAAESEYQGTPTETKPEVAARRILAGESWDGGPAPVDRQRLLNRFMALNLAAKAAERMAQQYRGQASKDLCDQYDVKSRLVELMGRRVAAVIELARAEAADEELRTSLWYGDIQVSGVASGHRQFVENLVDPNSSVRLWLREVAKDYPELAAECRV